MGGDVERDSVVNDTIVLTDRLKLHGTFKATNCDLHSNVTSDQLASLVLHLTREIVAGRCKVNGGLCFYSRNDRGQKHVSGHPTCQKTKGRLWHVFMLAGTDANSSSSAVPDGSNDEVRGHWKVK
ncbi:unnamed protein product [Diplocarpon coronariae]|nr:hypothetical protein JHW43_001814 [Diplocarpon mali]